jgi:single-strand DNA-binding protein
LRFAADHGLESFASERLRAQPDSAQIGGSMNQVTIVGNLTTDPELRYTASGIPVANFTVAVSYRDYQDGAHQDRTDGFFGCVAWRTTAEHAAKTLKKGTRAIVAGKLVQRKFEDGDGNKRSVIEIQVGHVGPDLQFSSAEVGPSAATPADQVQRA